jgi:hypothetical protein
VAFLQCEKGSLEDEFLVQEGNLTMIFIGWKNGSTLKMFYSLIMRTDLIGQIVVITYFWTQLVAAESIFEIRFVL